MRLGADMMPLLFITYMIRVQTKVLKNQYCGYGLYDQHLLRFYLFKSQTGWLGYWILTTIWMLFTKSMLNEFKVQNRFQDQSQHVKVLGNTWKLWKNAGKHFQSISESIQQKYTVIWANFWHSNSPESFKKGFILTFKD